MTKRGSSNTEYLDQRALFFVAVAAVVVPSHGFAGVFDVYGFDARAMGLGQAVTAAVDDYSATYYNVAALTVPKQITFGIGLHVAFPQLYVDRRLPFCSDGAERCGGQFGQLYSTIPTAKSETFAGLNLGVISPLGGWFQNRVAVGFGLHLPLHNLLRAEALDPAKPQFYMYGSLPDTFALVGGVAGEPVDWLSFGIGFQVLADMAGEVDLNIDTLSGTFESTELVVDVKPKANLTAGLLVRPVEGLAVGLSWRGDLDLVFSLPVVAKLGGLADIVLDIGGTVLYTPHQITLGLSYRIPEPSLLLSADISYSMWSFAGDPSPSISVDLQGGLVEGLGVGTALDVGKDTKSIQLGLTDTWSPRVGLEWEPLHWLKLRTGYQFRPTPAPVQSGPTNYLDNHAHGVGFGASFSFFDPFEAHRTPIEVHVGNSFLLLSPRKVDKSEAHDPVGDLVHGGFIYSASLTVIHRY
ncbi:MAG: TonB-dependent receptor [Myxococcales bacterium]|nr:TonB-dependent receptor [Myxococcales bacterium]